MNDDRPRRQHAAGVAESNQVEPGGQTSCVPETRRMRARTEAAHLTRCDPPTGQIECLERRRRRIRKRERDTQVVRWV